MSFSRYDEDGARTSHHTHCCIGARRATHCALGDNIAYSISHIPQTNNLIIRYKRIHPMEASLLYFITMYMLFQTFVSQCISKTFPDCVFLLTNNHYQIQHRYDTLRSLGEVYEDIKLKGISKGILSCVLFCKQL